MELKQLWIFHQIWLEILMMKLFLSNPQVLRFHKPFANDSSANTKLSKTQLHKIGQSRGFLGRPSGPFLKNLNH